jgi:AcrR family transcriptional regulator
MTDGKRGLRRPRADRERIVLDTAARLFYARGVHEVGMDELVRESGLGKATVYRLFPAKDALVGAYLNRLSAQILALIDADAAGPPRAALHAVIDAVARDVARPDFRGCPFNNASIEFADPAHPARAAARDYRAALHDRLGALTTRLCPDPVAAAALAGQLAVLIDGAYTNGAHLGPAGPAAAGLQLARTLVDRA